jgi:hypothetical protein
MATVKATADPPFDFAQGRLFGDDNKKSKSYDKCKCKCKRRSFNCVQDDN